MSGPAITGGSLPLSGRGGEAAGGTPAEQAVRRAEKAYAQATRRLLEDGRNHAAQDVLEVDRAAVDLAAGALAQARAALAREQRQAAGQPSADAPDRLHRDPVEHVEATARRDRHRLDDALAAALSVDVLA